MSMNGDKAQTPWRSRSVLVTGGASFIGSHLVDRLVAEGARVRVADDLSSGTRENLVLSIDTSSSRRGPARAGLRSAVHGRPGARVPPRGSARRTGLHRHAPGGLRLQPGSRRTVVDEAWRAGVEHVCFASSACVYPVDLQDKPRRRRDDPSPRGVGGPVPQGRGCIRRRIRLGQAHGRDVAWRLLQAARAEVGLLQALHRLWGARERDARRRRADRQGVHRHGSLRDLGGRPAGPELHLRQRYRRGDDSGRAGDRRRDPGEHRHGRTHQDHRPRSSSFSPRQASPRRALIFDLSKPVGVYSRAADLTRARERLGWEPETSFEDGLARTIAWYYAHRDREEVLRSSVFCSRSDDVDRGSSCARIRGLT